MSTTAKKITTTTVLKGTTPANALPVISNDFNPVIDDILDLENRVDAIEGGTVTLVDIVLSSTVDATSKDTGSFITEGGIGIEKAIFAGGKITTTDTTESTSTSTGSIITSGGIGIAKDAYFGDDIFVADDANITGSLTALDIFLTSSDQVGSDTPSSTTATGTITTAVTATAAGAMKTVTVTHTLVGASSKVFVSLAGYGGTGTPIIAQVTPSLGQFIVLIYNAHTANALSAAMDLKFMIVN